MIEYFLLCFICLILIYSNFVHLHPKTTSMIAYVGKDHPRLFERQYIRHNADLFVFRNKAYNSINMKYEKKGSELEIFYKSDYQNMLVIRLLHFNVQIDKEIPTIYKHDNKTVAEYYVKNVQKAKRKIFI